MKKKNICYAALSLAAAIVLLCFLQRLLMPKYMGRVVEGNFTEEYYQDTKKHDVLILGDCEAYENISPVTLWNEYGITSYIRGNAQQLIPQSYYLLEDTLRYETPKVVILSIAAMQQYEQEQETFNRMTMDGMRWSSSKYNAIRATMMDGEHMVEYLVPLLRFHSRWKEVSEEDIRCFWNKDKTAHQGYYLRADVRPAGDFPTMRRRADYSFDDRAWEYLDRILGLCRENGIELILMKAPSLYPVWYDQWDEQIVEYADRNGLTYINCIDNIDSIGIDFDEDTYDGGLHMNVFGAEKMARFLGAYLSGTGILEDHRGDAELSAGWQEISDRYEMEKASQMKEFSELGYLEKYQSEDE